MTAAELIAELMMIPPTTQIRVYADHGQSCMMASTSGMQMIHIQDKDKWMADTIHPDDIEEGEAVELFQVFEIGAP